MNSDLICTYCNVPTCYEFKDHPLKVQRRVEVFWAKNNFKKIFSNFCFPLDTFQSPYGLIVACISPLSHNYLSTAVSDRKHSVTPPHSITCAWQFVLYLKVSLTICFWYPTSNKAASQQAGAVISAGDTQGIEVPRLHFLVSSETWGDLYQGKQEAEMLNKQQLSWNSLFFATIAL